MKGQHKPGYRRPRTGEPRLLNRSMKVDKLPEAVREALKKAKAAGKTWEEIAEAASKAAGSSVSVMACHRWHDVRIEQREKEIEDRVAFNTRVVAAWSKGDLKELGKATLNAAADLLFEFQQYAKEGAAAEAALALMELNKLLGGMEKLRIEREKLSLSRERLEQMRAKVTGLKGALSGKKKISNAELEKKLDEIYGLTQPNAA